ncbi:MAG: twin-arginine translocase subunit TatC [Sulfolobales archaeon]
MERDVEEKRLSFSEHFEELSSRLKRIVIFYVVVSAILFTPLNVINIAPHMYGSNSSISLESFVRSLINMINTLSGVGYDSLTTRFIRFTREYMLPPEAILMAGGSTTPLLTIIRVTMILALLISTPYIAYEILAFVWPALYRHEKRVLKKYLTLIVVYVVGGLLAGYFIVAKIVIRVGLIWAESVGAQYYITLSNFIDEVFNAMIGSLIIFLIPLALIIATELDFVNPERGFMRNRKILYVVIWILLVFFLPDITAIVLFLLFILVYEPSYAYMKHIVRSRIREQSSSSLTQ